MASIKRFEDLLVWQKSHYLVLKIYNITGSFPDDEKYGLTSQQRRAATSIASNIVEGFRRKGIKDSLHFYNMALSSLDELKYQTLLSKDLGYVTNDEYFQIKENLEEVSKMLYSWLNNIRNTNKAI